MGQIHQQAKVVVGHSHVCRELCRIRSRSDERCLVHVKIEHFQFHVHALLCRVIADIAGGL